MAIYLWLVSLVCLFFRKLVVDRGGGGGIIETVHTELKTSGSRVSSITDPLIYLFTVYLTTLSASQTTALAGRMRRPE